MDKVYVLVQTAKVKGEEDSIDVTVYANKDAAMAALTVVVNDFVNFIVDNSGCTMAKVLANKVEGFDIYQDHEANSFGYSTNEGGEFVQVREEVIQ